MPFTALHRLLGQPSGPITDEMLDQAVVNGLAETDDLDWKSKLPELNSIAQGDYPKDIAAMANSGGGTIVYGIEEAGKRATGRRDTGELDERYESALRSAAVTAISPPIFGLEFFRLGGEGTRAVAIVVPASTDGPHLIYRNEYFGAPIRNNADTVWMKERQIETMYRARFDERRRSTDALVNLYEEAVTNWRCGNYAQLVAVARPRVPAVVGGRPTRGDAVKQWIQAEQNSLSWTGRDIRHPIQDMDRGNPRPGLRRWVFPTTAITADQGWQACWMALHNDGSVSFTAVVGGRPNRGGRMRGGQVASGSIEIALSDFMAFIVSQAIFHSTPEYEVRVGIEYQGDSPLVISTMDRHGFLDEDGSIPLARFVPVTSTLAAGVEPLEDYWQLSGLAEDCVNQGGITDLQYIKPRPRHGPRDD